MALEAAVLSEGLFGCWAMASAPGGGWSWGHGGAFAGEGVMDLEDGSAAAFWNMGTSASASAMMHGAVEEPGAGSAALSPEQGGGADDLAAQEASAGGGRRKRRRAKTVKNWEEVESQRMTHIAVERNRRRQMNDYLAVLRSLMPPSYVQRGDQASIIGGAINYVKELEQLLQSLEARKHADDNLPPAAASPFAGFFTFPQYSMSAGARSPAGDGNAADPRVEDGASGASRPSSVADIEVTMVESHANLKLLSRRRPRQLLRLLAGLQAHRLTVLHLNVTSAGQMALYSLSLKVEDDCALSSVDDMATMVHRIVEAIDQEASATATAEEQGGGELMRSEMERNNSPCM